MDRKGIRLFTITSEPVLIAIGSCPLSSMPERTVRPADSGFMAGHQRLYSLKLHTGLDIFGGNPVGVTPIYAPYDGFLTRESDWKSSVIIRIPEDPLDPSRQIWVYMTHLADVDGNPLIDEAFPAGTHEKPVKKGDLIGYQGNYSGYPGSPTGIHLHISIVKDDGDGHLNEMQISNTLDPSPYFGMQLHADRVDKNDKRPVCLP